MEKRVIYLCVFVIILLFAAFVYSEYYNDIQLAPSDSVGSDRSFQCGESDSFDVETAKIHCIASAEVELFEVPGVESEEDLQNLMVANIESASGNPAAPLLDNSPPSGGAIGVDGDIPWDFISCVTEFPTGPFSQVSNTCVVSCPFEGYTCNSFVRMDEGSSSSNANVVGVGAETSCTKVSALSNNGELIEATFLCTAQWTASITGEVTIGCGECEVDLDYVPEVMGPHEPEGESPMRPKEHQPGDPPWRPQ